RPAGPQPCRLRPRARAHGGVRDRARAAARRLGSGDSELRRLRGRRRPLVALLRQARAHSGRRPEDSRVIDPLERWRALGLPDKPDYARLLTFGGMPYTQDAAELRGAHVAIVGAPLGGLVSDRPGPRRAAARPGR